MNVTYGSSGNFFAQLQNGAPFDLFFSADIGYPRKLAEKGLGADDVFLYAIGRIVVWVPEDSPVAVDKLGIKTLLEPSIRKIAVANPEHAPYGRAAVAALKTLNVYDQVASRLVYGENIGHEVDATWSAFSDAPYAISFVSLDDVARAGVTNFYMSDDGDVIRSAADAGEAEQVGVVPVRLDPEAVERRR